MKFNEDLAAIHAYLCADGYVIKNPETQKNKYYRIGLRNTNLALLSDFQQRFFRYFAVLPHLREGQRCDLGSKGIYYFLTEQFSYYSYEWEMPALTKKQLSLWLRAYFDCEGWVECQRAKSRLIRAECVNEKGIRQVQKALLRFGIPSTLKLRIRPKITIWRLTICGLKYFKRFQKEIGFLHPDKKTLLQEVITSYKNYFWNLPTSKRSLFRFIRTKGRLNLKRKQIRFWSIIKNNLIGLKKELFNYNIISKIDGPWINQHGSCHYSLTILASKNKNKRIFVNHKAYKNIRYL